MLPGTFYAAILKVMSSLSISPIGTLVIVAGLVLVSILRRRPSTPVEWSIRAVLIVGAMAMYLHLVPGFQNILLLNRVQVSTDGVPFTMYLNFDKMAAALILLWAFVQPPRLDISRVLKTTAMILPLTLLVLAPLALIAGYVRWDPKFPNFTWLWMFNNLLFVCFSEEVLFRGVIQGRLKRTLSGSKLAAPISIMTGAVLFGLAHYKGGATYVIFATIAGVFYGLAYHRAERLEAAILVHFGLNTVHFFLFTYPALG